MLFLAFRQDPGGGRALTASNYQANQSIIYSTNQPTIHPTYPHFLSPCRFWGISRTCRTCNRFAFQMWCGISFLRSTASDREGWRSSLRLNTSWRSPVFLNCFVEKYFRQSRFFLLLQLFIKDIIILMNFIRFYFAIFYLLAYVFIYEFVYLLIYLFIKELIMRRCFCFWYNKIMLIKSHELENDKNKTNWWL